MSNEIESYNITKDMSSVIATARIIPQIFQNSPADCFIALQTGKELGMQPMASLNGIHIILGRPSLSVKTKAAIAKNHATYGGMETIEIDDGYKIVISRNFGNGVIEKTESSFTTTDAQKAGLVKKDSGWEKYPKRMCLARAKGLALDDAFPDLYCGLYSTEEIESFANNESQVQENKPQIQEIVTQEAQPDSGTINLKEIKKPVSYTHLTLPTKRIV